MPLRVGQGIKQGHAFICMNIAGKAFERRPPVTKADDGLHRAA